MSTLTPIRIVVTGSTNDASRSIKDLDNNLDNTERRLKSFGSALTSLGKVTVIGSLATGAIQLTAALLPAVGVLAILPAVALASAAAISTLFVGLHGIADAFKTSGTAAGGAAVNTRGLQRAVEAASRGIVTAEREVVSAERDVADAQDKVTEAQKKLDQARKQAAQTIQEYTDKVTDANLAEEDAAIALTDAQANLQTMQNNGVTDALALQKASLQVREAQQRLKEATENAAQTQADATKAQADGVDGADQVVQAQKDVVSANRDLTDSQDKVVRAQEQVVLANQQLADAQAALAEATTKGTAAQNKAAAAMAALSPNARATVQAILGLKSVWKDLHNAVQDKLFEGFATEVKNLAASDLPLIKTGMVAVAGSFNQLGLATSGALQTPMFKGAMTDAFNAAHTAVSQLVPAIGPFITGLANLSTVGTPFFTRFTGWIAHLMESAGAFLSSAHGAEVMRGVLANAVGVLQRVWDIGKNVTHVMLNIFKGADAGNLLQSIQNITGELAKWTGSAEGQEKLTQLFSALGQVASTTAGVLPKVATAVVAIATAFNHLPGPLKDSIAQFAAWAIVMGPALGGISKVSQGIKGAGDIFGGSKRFIKAFGEESESATGKFIGGMVRASAVAVRDGAVFIARMIAIGVVTVGSWIAMAASATASAVVMAAAWLISIWPIALVIAAVVGLALIIWSQWDNIKKWTGEAFDWVSNKISGAIDWLTGVFLHWTGPGLLISHWADIKRYAGEAWDWVTGKIGGVLDWIGGLGGQISKLSAGMWDGLKSAFKAAINWIIDGWNKLQFKIPSFDLGPVHVGGFTLGLPQIPQLAKGAIVHARPGGTLVNVGEAGRDEAVVPLPHNFGGDSGGSSQPVVIHFEPSYSFGNVYGVEDLQRLLDENNEKQSKKLLQLIEAS